MAGKEVGNNALVSFYTDRITEPSTDDEVYGYWVFALGLVASILGVLLFMYTTTLERGPAGQGGTYWMLREASLVLAAGGVPLMLGGVAIRLPLRKAATYLTYLGIVVCLGSLAWFVTVYPAGGWPLDTGHTGVIAMYAGGLAIIGLASVVVPMLSRAETSTASERLAIDQQSATETAEREQEASEDAAASEELSRTREERDQAVAAAEASAAEAEALRQSQARFETYEDAGGQYRWRLRHRNGNVIATSGEGYSSRQKAQQGMQSVRRNALGAGVMAIEPEESETFEETVAEPIDEPEESQASFELFEDDAGEWRWRLVHDNGNVLADSGEGYASKSNARRAMTGVRENATVADYLRIDPAGYEVYRDRGGEWRWRLVHKNGNVLADSGEGYASRQKARQGLDSVRNNVGDAAIEE